MTYMKKLVVTLMLLGCLQTMAQKKTEGKMIISGTITGDTKGYNKIYMYSGHEGGSDSAEMKDGVFTFEKPFTGPVVECFVLEYTLKKGMMYVPFGVLIDKPAVLHMTGDVDKGLNKAVVTGSETEELYQDYNAKERAASSQVYEVLKSLYGKMWMEDDDPQAQAFSKSRDSLQQLYVAPVILHFVKAHPGSYTSAFILNASAREVLSATQKQEVYGMLSSEMKKTQPAKEFQAFNEGIKNSAIGRQVQNFTLQGPDGKTVRFDQLKGKYVLIDFWASWCVPCRQSFPRMREIYKKYKGDQFEMYSISIDQSKEAWLKAVKEESNPWLQALDTTDIAKSGFAVSAVPTAYLVDPNGKILMKQVGFDTDKEGPIELKLDELLK